MNKRSKRRRSIAITSTENSSSVTRDSKQSVGRTDGRAAGLERFQAGRRGRGVGRPEVVDDDVRAEMLQRLDAGTVAIDVGEQRRSPTSSASAPGSRSFVRCACASWTTRSSDSKWRTRHVDRDGQRLSGCARPPGCCLTRRLVDDVAPELGRHLGALDRAEEVAGPQQPSCGVVPSQQRFDPAEAAVVQVDDRLVREDQFVPVEGALQLLVGIGEHRRHERYLSLGQLDG